MADLSTIVRSTKLSAQSSPADADAGRHTTNMHSALTTVILLFAAVGFTCAIPEDGDTSVTTAASTATTAPACFTGKHVKGTCVQRGSCDFGSAIDFTLYQSRGYKLSCLSGEVCCPPQFIVLHDEKSSVPHEEVLDFDDDD